MKCYGPGAKMERNSHLCGAKLWASKKETRNHIYILTLAGPVMAKKINSFTFYFLYWLNFNSQAIRFFQWDVDSQKLLISVSLIDSLL